MTIFIVGRMRKSKAKAAKGAMPTHWSGSRLGGCMLCDTAVLSDAIELSPVRASCAASIEEKSRPGLKTGAAFHSI